MPGENVTGAHADRPSYRYRIRVRGRLGETICSAFPALQAQASGGDTVLTGPLPGRAAARDEDPLKQEGSPVHVPVTVEPPAGRCTGWVVST